MSFTDWAKEKEFKEVSNQIIRYSDIKKFINDVKGLLFPGYIDEVKNPKVYVESKIQEIKNDLCTLFSQIEGIESFSECGCFEDLTKMFLDALPEVEELLLKDVDFFYESDPAAMSKKEILICYPGFSAIATYRIAHILYELGIPILPRAISEYTHSKTGIDINPGAQIGEYFFIDHGTGVVIGETTIIGSHVKVYQGVTLGALSLSKGHDLNGTKRHPTIEDNVTIYSNASIFGGDTIIGKNSIIGANSYITSSIEEDTIVTIEGVRRKK